MRIHRKDRGPITVLELHGHLSGGPDSQLFDEQIAELIDTDRLFTVLDFGHLSFVGSPGLGILARNYGHYIRHGGRMVAARMSSRVALPFDLVLRRAFDVYDSVDVAVSILIEEREREIKRHAGAAQRTHSAQE